MACEDRRTALGRGAAFCEGPGYEGTQASAFNVFIAIVLVVCSRMYWWFNVWGIVLCTLVSTCSLRLRDAHTYCVQTIQTYLNYWGGCTSALLCVYNVGSRYVYCRSRVNRHTSMIPLPVRCHAHTLPFVSSIIGRSLWLNEEI